MPETTHLLSAGGGDITTGAPKTNTYTSTFSYHQAPMQVNGLSGVNLQYRSNNQHSNLAHRHQMRRNRLIKRRTTSSASMIQEEDSFRAAQCSSNSIFFAMRRFIESVDEMESAVLIPTKLKDMDSDEFLFNTLSPCNPATLSASGLLKSHKRQQGCVTRPSLSSNNSNTTTTNNFACPHELYLMLKDVKKELLWGPTVLNGGGCDEASELLLAAKPQQQLQPLSLSTSLTPSNNISSATPTNYSSASSSIVVHYPATDTSSAETSGIGVSDRDTDSDADSFLNSDRDSSSSTSEDDATTMLASSFRHHLLGLLTILNQLADTADTLTLRYLEEVERGNRR